MRINSINLNTEEIIFCFSFFFDAIKFNFNEREREILKIVDNFSFSPVFDYVIY